MSTLCLGFLFGSLEAQTNFTYDYNYYGGQVCMVDAVVDLTAPAITLRLLDASELAGIGYFF